MEPTLIRPWSCDTFVVRSTSRTSTYTLLGKNSDRPARESQTLARVPARNGRGRTLNLAYVEIADAKETLTHLGSSPYWCWGHEMGMNAAGVVIGNEALFTRDLAVLVDQEKGGETVVPGILGMELVRLALERAGTAHDAVSVMTELIERYGQWGSGTRGTDRSQTAYDNSYLVADREQTWVLETSGRRWVTRQVLEATWSLSNEPTIRHDFDDSSSDLHEHAAMHGWADGFEPLDFAAAFQDPQVPLQVSHIRLQRSRQLIADLLKANGEVSVLDAQRILRDHYEETFLGGPTFNPARPDFLTLCMHEHPAGFTWGNTAASLVAVLPESADPYLWWAAATPCTSVYLPVGMVSTRLPDALHRAGTARGAGPNPEKAEPDAYRQDSYWWTYQALLEVVCGDELATRYPEHQPRVRERLDPLQEAWAQEVTALGTAATTEQWDDLTSRCTEQSMAVARELIDEFTTG